MGTHPNVLLIAILTPDDLARKTYRAILAEAGVEGDADIPIGGDKYHHEVAEEDYLESWQIQAPTGSLVFFDLVTYGYGEWVAWDTLAAQKQELEEWARGICERHKCSFEIRISANYW